MQLVFPASAYDVFQRALARKEGLVELERAVHVGLRVQQMQEGGPAIGEMEKRECTSLLFSISLLHVLQVPHEGCCDIVLWGRVTRHVLGVMPHHRLSCYYMSVMTVKSHHMSHCDCHLTCDIVCVMACNGCPFSHPAYYACSIQVLE